jgi:glycosyltransferase involved in cell wall biosynthesis
MEHKNLTSIFIVPRGSSEWKGNEAGWITASGWAAAGEQLWGDAVVTTTDGLFNPRESRLFPRGNENSPERSSSSSTKKSIRKLVPEVFITAYKDWRLKNSQPEVWPIEEKGVLGDKEVVMVWERHDLFSGPGRRLADKYKVPLVTSVEALAVWEAEKWGVKRPIWGKYLENKVEAKSLKASDLVCCVSQEVKDKVVSMGIPENKVIVTPNRVDATLFNPEIDGAEIEEQYNLKGKKVLGWTGSFRSFHAIDNIINAFSIVHKKHPDTLLMLVGDGKEYDEIAWMVKENNLSDAVIMPGKKAFTDIPKYVANFYISLVSARSSEGFHYSPLKLREYMGAGKAVIAPKAGDIPTLFNDGSDLLLYEAGNYNSLAEKMLTLLENPELHKVLVNNSIRWFEKEGSWTHELKRVCDILKIQY